MIGRGEEGKNTHSFGVVEIEHLEDVGVNGNCKLKVCLGEIEWHGMDKIHMAKKRDNCL